MAKKHNRLKQITLVLLCILSIIPVFAVVSSATDYSVSTSGDVEYQVSGSAIRSLTFYDSDDPGNRVVFDAPGFIRGGAAEDTSASVLNPDSTDIGSPYFYASYQNMARIGGHYSNNTLTEYDLKIIPFYSSITRQFDTIVVNGSQFYAHEINADYNAAYAGHFPGELINSLFVGNSVTTVTVQLWQKYIYTSDLVEGSWEGIRYYTRTVSIPRTVDGTFKLAPLFSELAKVNAVNSISYVHNGNVTQTNFISSGNSAYVNVLSYETVFTMDAPELFSRIDVMRYRDILCDADSLDYIDGMSALNNGLSFVDADIEVGTFLKNSVAAFLDFEIFPKFSLSDLLWLILGFFVILALIFVFRK